MLISLSPIYLVQETLSVSDDVLDGKLVRNKSAEDATDYRPHNRYQRVFPVRRAFAGYWEDEVGDTRHEIAGGVDRVTSRSTQREADGEDQQANDQRGESARKVISGGRDRDHGEDQHEGPDDLADEVERWVADRWAGAEHRELQTRILGCLEVGAVGRPHEDRSDERSHELPAYVLRYVGPIRHTDDRQPDGHRGVEVRAVELADCVDGHRHGHAPSEGNHDPAAVLRLRLGKQHAGDDAVAQQDQQAGADDLREKDVVRHWCDLLGAISTPDGCGDSTLACRALSTAAGHAPFGTMNETLGLPGAQADPVDRTCFSHPPVALGAHRPAESRRAGGRAGPPQRHRVRHPADALVGWLRGAGSGVGEVPDGGRPRPPPGRRPP